MKRLNIIFAIIFCILVTYIVYPSNNIKIKLFESVDTDNITEISIFNPGASFNTNNKNDISEIMNYLKSLTLCKKSDGKFANTTPDIQIALKNKNGKVVNSIQIYGDEVILYPEKEYYIISATIYRDLEYLCNKLRNKKVS